MNELTRFSFYFFKFSLILILISCKKDKDTIPIPCLKISYFNNENQLTDFSILKYDESGNLLSTTSDKTKSIFEYNRGNLIKYTLLYNNQLNSVLEIEYDSINRKKREVWTHYYGNSNVIIKEQTRIMIYEYNSANKERKISVYDINNRLLENWMYEYSDLSIKINYYSIDSNNNTELNRYSITNLNNQKKVTTYEFYTKVSSNSLYLATKLNYEYNANGSYKTVNAKYYDSNGNMTNEEEDIYEYDENQQTKKITTFSITNSARTMTSYKIYERKCE